MKRRLVAVAALAMVAVLVAVTARAIIGQITQPFATSTCAVTGTSYEFSTEQAVNAATITAVGLQRGLPERAVVIALATALQESKLANLDYGDRDSLGLFQQRPSQGWGRPDQLMNPRYAAGKFYDELVKVRDWRTRPLTEAAQAVQRSGYPNEYAKWEPRAHALAHALVGAAPAGLHCAFPRPKPAGQDAAFRPDRVLAALQTDYPTIRRAGGAGPVVEVAPASWAAASWLVANAERLGVESVSYDGRTWTRTHGRDGWRPDRNAPRTTVRFTILSKQ